MKAYLAHPKQAALRAAVKKTLEETGDDSGDVFEDIKDIATDLVDDHLPGYKYARKALPVISKGWNYLKTRAKQYGKAFLEGLSQPLFKNSNDKWLTGKQDDDEEYSLPALIRELDKPPVLALPAPDTMSKPATAGNMPQTTPVQADGKPEVVIKPAEIAKKKKKTLDPGNKRMKTGGTLPSSYGFGDCGGVTAKYIDQAITGLTPYVAGSNTGTTGLSVYCLNAISSGNGINQRVNLGVCNYILEVNLTISPVAASYAEYLAYPVPIQDVDQQFQSLVPAIGAPGSGGTTNAYAGTFKYGYAVVWDTTPNSVQPAWNQVFDSNTPEAHVNLNYRNRFQVLYKQTRCFQYVGGSQTFYGNGGTSYGNEYPYFPQDKPVCEVFTVDLNDKKTIYNTNGATTFANIISGGLYFMECIQYISNRGGVLPGVISGFITGGFGNNTIFDYRLTYKDA